MLPRRPGTGNGEELPLLQPPSGALSTQVLRAKASIRYIVRFAMGNDLASKMGVDDVRDTKPTIP